MTIRKGEPWGRTIERPAILPTATSDAALATMIAEGVAGPIGLTDGDLHRSVGSPPERTEMQLLPIDVLDVVADGVHTFAVAHVIARRRWWRGRIVAVCNVDRVGDWDVAPRAHPNDGRADIIEVDPSMTIRERWQARQRLPTGTHVPHPRIATASTTERTWDFERPYAIWVDGRHVADARSLRVTVRPDAAEVLV